MGLRRVPGEGGLLFRFNKEKARATTHQYFSINVSHDDVSFEINSTWVCSWTDDSDAKPPGLAAARARDVRGCVEAPASVRAPWPHSRMG